MCCTSSTHALLELALGLDELRELHRSVFINVERSPVSGHGAHRILPFVLEVLISNLGERAYRPIPLLPLRTVERVAVNCSSRLC